MPNASTETPRPGTTPAAPVRAMLAVGVIVTLCAAGALGARASRGGQVTADEPQYLLTALSLAEDRDLDISDELADQRWRDFHQARLPRQTEPRPDGSELSPHDPLLPVLLAVPVGLGGWVGAKSTLAVAAGVLAALLVWTAVRRFGVEARVAAVVVGAFGVCAPLTTYGTQVYPELPAALAVTVAAAALTGPLDRRGRWVAGLAVVALPWLAVKYVPVAVVLAGLLLVSSARRRDRRAASGCAAALVVAAVGYAWFHRAVYGGWTVYAAGDHFVGGELDVVGDPDYVGRSARLVGLLVDRGFGLAAWAPLFLLVVPAVAALLRRRPADWPVLVLPAAAGWLNATFVALTMHGWWWPGRQVVVVLPLLVLAVAWWVDRVPRLVPLVVGLAAAGLALWWWWVAQVLAGAPGRGLVVGLDTGGGPVHDAWRWLLPDYRVTSVGTWVRHGLWLVALASLAVLGWRWAPPAPSGQHQDAGAGERADAHVAAGDLDGGGAVG